MTCQFIKSYQIDDLSVCDRIIEWFEMSEDKKHNKRSSAERRDEVAYAGLGIDWTQGIHELVEKQLHQPITSYMEDFGGIGGMHLKSDVTKVQKTLPAGGFHRWHFEDCGVDRREYLRKIV